MKVTVEFDIDVNEVAELQKQYLQFCMENGFEISNNNVRNFFESGTATAIGNSVQDQFIEAMKKNPFVQMNPFLNIKD